MSAVYTLVCTTCRRGWVSPVPQGVCGRCGTKTECRGQYESVDLR